MFHRAPSVRVPVVLILNKRRVWGQIYRGVLSVLSSSGEDRALSLSCFADCVNENERASVYSPSIVTGYTYLLWDLVRSLLAGSWGGVVDVRLGTRQKCLRA
eukprot:8336803-Pyramimonas_sp.AAC.2